VRRTGLGGVFGRHVQRPTRAVIAIGEIQMRAMPMGGIVMTGARDFATAPEGFRQPALNHRLGHGVQRPHQGFTLTHVLERKVVQA
jgi:hypothetical protein